MPGKKGMKHYPQSIKEEIVSIIQSERSISSLHREYGISRWAIQCWLVPERQMPKMVCGKRGRPRKTPISTQQELEIENQLLRDFLSETGRG